jgi:hypothetical protein
MRNAISVAQAAEIVTDGATGTGRPKRTRNYYKGSDLSRNYPF